MMCAPEEHDRLLESGSLQSKVYSKQRFLFALVTSAIFTAGFFSYPPDNNIPLLFASNLSSPSSDNVVAVANENSVNNQLDNGLAKENDTNDWDDDTSHDVSSSPLFNASFVNYLTSGMKKMLVRNHGTKVHYVYDSPFEKRWPDNELPYWSRKTIPFNSNIASDKQICFVHVGKAGGSTVGCMLGFSLHCDSDNEIKGLLPIVTTHAFHRGVNDCADDAAYYLFVVRDPLARMLSDMNYERPDMTEREPYDSKFHTKELYEECNFWTLEDLARNGLRNSNRDPLSKKCRARAYDAMTGIGKYLVHGYFNYQYYTQFVFGTEDNNDASTIPDNANLFVIRNNHMIDDYNTINKLLGGQPEALKPSDIPVNNVHDKNSTELYLSKHSKVALCQVLCNEIQIYKNIIRRAANLNDADVRSSIEEMKGVCPREAVENACLEKRRKMRKKIEKRKGEHL